MRSYHFFRFLSKSGKAAIFLSVMALTSCGSSSNQEIPVLDREPEISEAFRLEPVKRVALVWKGNVDPGTDALITSNFLKRGYIVAARDDLDRVLNEIKFQHSGLTEKSRRAIQSFLNVEAIVLLDYVDMYAAPCKIVSLRSGSILHASADCGMRNQIPSAPARHVVLGI